MTQVDATYLSGGVLSKKLNKCKTSEFKVFGQPKTNNKLQITSNLQVTNNTTQPENTNFTSMRTIKSAPFRNTAKLSVENVNKPLQNTNKPNMHYLRDIENLSAFLVDSPVPMEYNNGKNFYKKYPSLDKHAELLRRSLFKKYMKQFTETNSYVRENFSKLDKYQVKNASNDVKQLLNSFEKSQSKHNFEIAKPGPPAIVKIDKKTKKVQKKLENKENQVVNNEIKTEDIENKNQENTDSKAPSGKQSHTPTSRQQNQQSRSHTNSNEDDRFFNTVQLVMKSNLKMQNYSDIKDASHDDLTIATQSGEIHVDESFDADKEIQNNDSSPKGWTRTRRLKAVTAHRKLSPTLINASGSLNTKITSTTASSGEFIENEDNAYYNRHKSKFIKNTEQAHKAMSNFARVQSGKLDKKFPRPEPPKLHSIDELNLDGEALRKQLRMSKFTRWLEENDAEKANKVANILSSKPNSSKTNAYTNFDDDSFIDFDDDEDEINRRYRIRLKKRENYMKLIQVMYNQARRNQIRTEKILNKGTELQVKIRNQLESKSESTLQLKAASETLATAAAAAITHEKALNSKNMFRISISARENISNYEIFIPSFNNQHKNNNNHSNFYNGSDLRDTNGYLNQPNELNSNNKNILPLTIDELRDFGAKIIESKSTSNYWRNYSK